MHRFFFAFVLFAVLALPQAVRAQSAPTASVSTLDECYLGDSVPFRIMIENASNATPPDLATVLSRDWSVTFVGVQPSSSSFTMIINGRVQEQKSQSVMLAYTISPRRAGEFTIPAIDVDVQGKTLRTKPTRIKVSEPAASQGLGSTVEPARAYVGQGVKLSLSWVLASNAEDVVFNLNLPPGAFDVYPLPRAAATAGTNRQAADIDYIDGPGGKPGKARGELVQVSIDGDNRLKFTADFLLIPKQAGKFDCGAARVDFHAVIGQRETSIFDPLGTRRSITQRRFAQAPAKSIEVLELPTAGRPANFSGLVGEFDLDAECQPRQAAVGDPLNLTLVLRGKLPLFDPPALDLSRQRSGSGTLAEQFRVPQDPVLPQVADSAAIYSAQIRPRSDKLTEVPPVELWYFDPVEEAYRAAKSNRIPLKVNAAPVVGLGALEGLAEQGDEADGPSEETSDPSMTQKLVPEKKDGLFPPLGVASTSPVVESSSNPALLTPVIVGSLVLPTGLWAAGAVLAARRRAAERDPAAWRRRGAVRRAERSLRLATASPTGVSAALRQFISSWFNLPPEAVTTGDAVEAVQTLDPVLGSRIRAILSDCDRRLYGPGDSSAWSESLAADAVAVVREIARLERSPSQAAAHSSGGAV